MLTITDEDIQSAEKWLLPEGQQFDKERRKVIKCLESKDILACPGSGKTTALLAKLIIISKQLPLDGNKGICVLTHTNVAIDTITQRIGLPAGKLFEYPNHFGTIQSFVDKYLTIPCYLEIYSNRPDKIDNDWYNAKLEQQKKFLGKKALAFCYKNQSYKNYPFSICFADFAITPENKCVSLGLDLNKSDEKEVFDKLLSLKRMVLGFGILSFDDAYHLAFHYLDRHPDIKSLFSQRFPYVFIDEMQDTDVKQLSLLGRLFDDSVVIQRTGDINQSIFSFTTENECCWQVQDQDILEITGSKRFSNSIATTIKDICIKPQDLKGNPEIPDISPIIIAFNDDSIGKVIPRFGDLIFEGNLHLETKQCFKAIGWIGKPHETKHTISSYWPTYEREIQTKNTEYSNLASYLMRENDEFIRINGVKYYKRSIVRALLKCLRIVDKPSGTPLRSETAFFRYIGKNEKFSNASKIRISEWCLEIHRGQSVFKEIGDFVRKEFKSFFSIDNINLLDSFLAEGITQTKAKPIVPAKTNTYTHIRDGSQIKIEISTVHGVKGQTHTATLYLETFHYDYDIIRIIEYLKGKYIPPTQKRIRSNLRVTYVGMSRPSHLLCVAVHEAHLAGHMKELQTVGWKIDSTLCT
jgi:DNA helicase-2/ATP-dependent DNA helicase PcrA